MPVHNKVDLRVKCHAQRIEVMSEENLQFGMIFLMLFTMQTMLTISWTYV